ncbi:thioredoxin family protein [Flavobacterium sp.]|jgi:thioredoxin-related protein|uniref:thioredoxin family protein n=1 Tax=Flavobacterium sp. TaxID=239 RepID=UPI0037BF4FB5
MKTLKSKLIIVAIFLISSYSQAQNKKYTDYEIAKSEAIKQNKDILIVLTGSDWCKPCIKMKKNVFLNPEFIKLAEDKLIIMEINLERHIDMDSKVYKDYDFFKMKYQTNTLPCLILIDKNEATKSVISEGLTSFDRTYKRISELTSKP